METLKYLTQKKVLKKRLKHLLLKNLELVSKNYYVFNVYFKLINEMYRIFFKLN